MVAFLATVSSQAQTIISLEFPNGGTNNYSNSFAGQNLTAGVMPDQYWNADAMGGGTVAYPPSLSRPNVGNFP